MVEPGVVRCVVTGQTAFASVALGVSKTTD